MQIAAFDASARVANVHDEVIGGLVERHAHLDKALLCELQSVLDQVDQDLLQSNLVSHELGKVSCGGICLHLFCKRLREQFLDFSLTTLPLLEWRVQELLNLEEEVDTLRASLFCEDFKHVICGVFRVKHLRSQFELLFLEEAVVQHVVDEV